MRTSRLQLAPLLPLLLAAACGGDDAAAPDGSVAAADGALPTADARPPRDGDPGLDGGGGVGGALIIGHEAVADFDRIPPEWLAAAKALTVHYAHTSHGSQLLSGAATLEQIDAAYAIAVRANGTEGLPPEEDPPALRVYDGNPPETYITPELYWDSDAGRASTRGVAGTGSYGVSMWSWCGQQSSNDDATVDRYLATMSAFEAEFPDMRFVLFTGHTDGSDTPETPGTLKYNNARVRAYAEAHEMIVFDFADIESWDPAGVEHPDTTDACDWCAAWCDAHPADCATLPDECAHSHGLNCLRKGKAFWTMMARLAGWEG